MPKRPRNGAPDKDGWRLVGAGRGMLPAPDVTVSAGRSVPTALPSAASDRPEQTPGVCDASAVQSTPPALPMVVDDCPAPACRGTDSAGRLTPPSTSSAAGVDDRTGRLASPSTSSAAAANDCEQSGTPPALQMATDDCSTPTAGTSSATEHGGFSSPRSRAAQRRHQPMRGFTPRACLQCDWTVVYDCRSALNRHMRAEHGVFYSAKRDCYVALRGGEPRVRQQSGRSALRHSTRTTSTGSNAERRKLPKLASEGEEPSQPIRRNRRRCKPAPANPGARGARSVTVCRPRAGRRLATGGWGSAGRRCFGICHPKPLPQPGVFHRRGVRSSSPG